MLLTELESNVGFPITSGVQNIKIMKSRICDVLFVISEIICESFNF